MIMVKKKRKKGFSDIFIYIDENENVWKGKQMDILSFLEPESNELILPQQEKEEFPENYEEEFFEEDMEADSSDILEKNKDVIEMYDKYKAGEIEKAVYSEFMYHKLNKFIRYFLKNTIHATASKEDYEDMYAEGVLRLLEDLESYDPRVSLPTTWFSSHMYKCIKHPSGMSAHYTNAMRKLKKVAKDNGYEDVNDVEPHRLAILADMSLVTVIETLRLHNVQVVSNTDGLTNLDVSTGSSPEDVYLEKEKKHVISKMLDILSPVEKFIIQLYIDEDENGKIRSDSKILKIINDNLKVLKLKKPLNAQSLNKMKNVALMKMREDSGQYLFNNEDSYIKEDFKEEQATEEDIYDAFEEGILF